MNRHRSKVMGQVECIRTNYGHYVYFERAHTVNGKSFLNRTNQTAQSVFQSTNLGGWYPVMQCTERICAICANSYHRLQNPELILRPTGTNLHLASRLPFRGASTVGATWLGLRLLGLGGRPKSRYRKLLIPIWIGLDSDYSISRL